MVLTLAAKTMLRVLGDKLKMNAFEDAVHHVAIVYPSVSQHCGRFHQALEFHF